VNLPMLIRALTYRDQTLEQMLAKAVSGGCEGVMRMPHPPDRGTGQATGQADAPH
jgi:mannose/fructose-specific phosphotransferase system component IIA